MFNDLSSVAAFLASRRSGKPRDMVAPGPDEAQLRRIVATASRVPDHGKLAPWRFVVIGQDQRDAFAALLGTALRTEKPGAGQNELDAAAQFARQAPALVAVVSTPARTSPIPEREQFLSAGAACMMLLAAAHAEGFVAGWLTGWAATSRAVVAGLGFPDGEIAGFVFIGTPGRALDERPRPDVDQILVRWTPDAS